VLTVIYDVMQTLPVFSYLVPVLLFFGFGPVAALIATVVFSMPPMARVTTLALRRLPGSIGDFGAMAGCTPRQRMWLALLTAARRGLLIGLNQVIMLSLSVVIIASIIGAGGLGSNVLQELKSLQLGRAVEAGLGITLLAILLDQLSRAVALRRPSHDLAPRQGLRHPMLVLAFAVFSGGWLAATIMPNLGEFPKVATISTGRFWNDIVDWLNLALRDEIGMVRSRW
jgi:glycine betaine/proline transport system permease protein